MVYKLRYYRNFQIVSIDVLIGSGCSLDNLAVVVYFMLV